MVRTAEQKAADERLEAAIEDALLAYGIKDGYTADYAVIVAQQQFGADGSHSTSICRLLSGDGVPHYRVLGLLDYAATAYRHEITVRDAED